MSLFEFEMKDNLANSKSEKIIVREETSNQLRYEEFHRYCHRYFSRFHTTAKRMASFKDNSNIEQYAPFEKVLPRYNDMNMDQIKSYFIWRTKVRNGIVEPISISYVYVYIYELLHLVGVSNAEKGFLKLIFFWENAVVFAPEISESLATWMTDFVEYYNLPINYLEHPMLKSHILSYESDADKLVKALSMRDYSAICDIIARKGYNYRSGAFSSNADEVTLEKLIINLLKNIIETNDYILYNSIGSITQRLFKSAVFEPLSNKKYNRCPIVRKSVKILNNQYMIELGRTIEIALDEIFGIPQKLTNKLLYRLNERDAEFIKKELKNDVIKNKIVLLPKITPPKKNYNLPNKNYALENKNEVNQKPSIIEINIGSLSEIRQTADSIAERLIPEDLLKEYKEEPKLEIVINNIAVTNDNNNAHNEWAAFFNNLDNHGKRLIAFIMDRSSYEVISRYAIGNYLMLEEEIEKVNNSAIEIIGDTVIVSNENEFSIHEEYLAELARFTLSD